MENEALTEYERCASRAKELMGYHHRDSDERSAHAAEAQAWATLALAAAVSEARCQHEASDHPF